MTSRAVSTYRGTDVSRDSIARALEVGSLIEGSVEPVGDRIRVIARLVDGNSGADVQAASFELPAGQLLAALDSLGRETARLLRRTRPRQ